MKVLVTGAAGDLGRRVVERLVIARHNVIALVRPGSPRAQAPAFPQGVEQLTMDLAALDPERLPGGVDAVIALAQSALHRQFPEQAREIFDVNVAANLRLLDWARRRAVKRFVFASSGGVYGTHARAMHDEKAQCETESPASFYLATKLCVELLLEGFGPFFRSAVTLRPFFIYGPGQRREMLIPRLIESVRDGRPIHLKGNDGLRLSPIFVEDAAQAFAAALDLEGCHALDVAGPEVLTLREVGEAIGRQIGRAPVFEHRPGLPTDYVASLEKTRAKLPIAQTRFADGLARTLAAT
jgi:nucleoside-diphosphate-sugar epimerase